MKVDKIIKNAKVFTSDVKNLNATAFAVKDGKFVYVGDEEGLKDYEGEVIDLGGKFVSPAFMDCHAHLPVCVGTMYIEEQHNVSGSGKQECLKAMKDFVAQHPDYATYTFQLSLVNLGGEILTKEDLDEVSSEKEVYVIEAEMHSAWFNSLIQKNMGITDDTPDMAEGLSYYVRDEKGHITGNCFEGPHFCILYRHSDRVPNETMEKEFEKWVNFCKTAGVSAIFDAGTPGSAQLTERGLEVLCDMDRRGKLPVMIDASYMVFDPAQASGAIEELTRQHNKFKTEHVQVNTLKILLDGTLNIRTANMVTPYEDTHTKGGRLFDENQIADFLRELNKLGFNLHTHCVAEGSVKTVLDAVEIVKKELGDDFRVRVTIAHNEVVRDEDIPRYNELGVFVNFTPWWHSGCCVSGGYKQAVKFLGKRADKMYRCKSVWDTGATVTWSSDNTYFGDFSEWNPLLGIEIGMTREITSKTVVPAEDVDFFEKFPDPKETMSMEEMLLGFTINGAAQLGLTDRKGSLEAGKDADYLVFEEDLLHTAPEGISRISPKEVYFNGVKMN